VIQPETSLHEIYLEVQRLKSMDNRMDRREGHVELVMEETFAAILDIEEILEAVVELVREAAGGMTVEIGAWKLIATFADQEMIEDHRHFGMTEVGTETVGIGMIISEGAVLPHPRDEVDHQIMALGKEKLRPVWIWIALGENQEMGHCPVVPPLSL